MRRKRGVTGLVPLALIVREETIDLTEDERKQRAAGAQVLVMFLVIVSAFFVGDASALGVGAHPLSYVPVALLGGAGLGLGLARYAAVASRVLTARGLSLDLEYIEEETPKTSGDWERYLLFGLPLVVLAEELLFRGVLIGLFSSTVAASFPVVTPALVVGSAVVFALVHTRQGEAAVAVNIGTGLALGTVFAVTNSILFVVTAHYVSNALLARANARATTRGERGGLPEP